MEGWKIVAARRAVARMIDTLSEGDRFCVLAFDDVVETPPGLTAGLSGATDRNRFRAVEYLATMESRGGTEMAGPLAQAVKLLNQGSRAKSDRVLVLITDGQVGNEDQILKTLGNRLGGMRIFTLGIDRAVNEAFLRRLSERGGGSCELVESEDRLDEVMAAVHRRIGVPLLTGLSLTSDELGIEPGEIVPSRLPDLFAGSPRLSLGRYRGRPAGDVIILATDGAGRAFSEPVTALMRDNPAIGAAWARGQIRQLEDRYAAGEGDRSMLERAIIAVSLKYQVLCRFTAYVAVDRSQVVNEGRTLHRITQPVEQPEGWTDYEATRTSRAIPAHLSRPVQVKANRVLGRSRAADEVPRLDAFHALAEPPPPSPSDDSGLFCCDVMMVSPDRPELINNAFGIGSGAQPTPPVSLPDRFEAPQRISTGGMGQKYKAFDRQRGRFVIVKVVPRDGLDPDSLARWRQLVESLSILSHPAFIPILEVGESEGSLWIVTPLIEGRSLSDCLKVDGRMAPREAAALVAELAEALHLAHQHGLVHGDIAPSNILILADGHPRLLELGEARVGLTRDRQEVYGNPNRLAPELVRGDGDPRDPRVDVYGLGVILYEVLTNRRPFSDTPTPRLISSTDPGRDCRTPLRRIIRSIPAELEAICLKVRWRRIPTRRSAVRHNGQSSLRCSAIS